MSNPLRPLRALIETVSDIKIAVRASREYTRLSRQARYTRADDRQIGALLPR